MCLSYLILSAKRKKTKKVIKEEGENKQDLDSFIHLQDKAHTLLRSVHPSIFYCHVSCTPRAHPRQGTPWTSGQSVAGLAGTNKLCHYTVRTPPAQQLLSYGGHQANPGRWTWRSLSPPPSLIITLILVWPGSCQRPSWSQCSGSPDPLWLLRTFQQTLGHQAGANICVSAHVTDFDPPRLAPSRGENSDHKV